MGKIVTFYSYKGGAGRSMALANIAWILASNGYRVLAVDWDLEAPGLHRYFWPFITDKNLTGPESEGLIDLMIDFSVQLATPSAEPVSTTWYQTYADVSKWAKPLTWPSGKLASMHSTGSIDFLCAGRQGAQYGKRVNSFDWINFYDHLNGGAFIDALRSNMSRYDWVLIDSRTGVSDTAGICTIQLPDILVVCLTLNHQNIDGAYAVASSVRAQRPDIRIWPILMRIDGTEHKLLTRMKNYAAEKFTSLLDPSITSAQEYWYQMEAPYIARYAYHEILAPFEDHTGITTSVLPAMERLTRYITNDTVRQLVELPQEHRIAALKEFERDPSKPSEMGEGLPVDIAKSRHELVGPESDGEQTSNEPSAGMGKILSIMPGWLIRGGMQGKRKQRETIPKALKGLLPYTENDGERFSKLERQAEIQLAIALIEDSSTSVVAIYGPSGSGKTSLLRAGILYTLRQRQAESKSSTTYFIYWSAVDTRPASALAGFIEASTGLECEDNLTNLLRLETMRLVIIIDQFERLRRHDPHHKPIFDLIAALCRQPAPYSLQLVIAFSNDYVPEWLGFQDEAAMQLQKITVGPFTVARAANVMKVVLADAQVNVGSDVIDRYINDIVDDGLVSPVGIALGALAFSKWNQAAPGEGVPLQDYATAGGAVAVLRAHVRDRLGPAYIRSQDRDQLLRALMSTLVDTDYERRNPQGASTASIAKAANLDIARVKTYLKDLEAGRILEAVPTADVYVLAHDRLVPVLRELAQDITRTDQSIVDQYLLWKRQAKRKYLLRGQKLNWALTDPGSFLTGPDGFDRASYLNRSARARKRRYLTALMMALVLTVATASAWRLKYVSDLRKELVHYNLPPDLYDRQNQLESLVIDQAALSRLDWLHSPNLTDFAVASPQLDSLKGFSALSRLRSLDIDLNNVPLNTLREISGLHKLQSLVLRHIGRAQTQLVPDLGGLQELRTLDLDFEGSHISSLPNLESLQGLETLTLNLRSSEISTLPDLRALPHLRSVTILLDGSGVHSLEPLSKLDHLDTLVISMDTTQFQYLSDLSKSKVPLFLTLYQGFSRTINLPDLGVIPRLRSLTLQLPGSKAVRLPNLNEMKQLEDLTISLTGSDMTSLPDFQALTGLRGLDLSLESSAIKNLPNLAQMRGLERLTLNLNSNGVLEIPDLEHLDNLKELNLLLRESPIRSLRGIEHLNKLQILTLDIEGAQIQDIASIAEITSLVKLNLHLRWSQVNELPALSRLNNLRSLKLQIEGWWDLQQLPNLTHMERLEDLTIELEGSNVSKFPDLSKLPHLRTITLNLRNSEMQDLSALAHVSSLEELVLDLQGSLIENLPDLMQIKELRNVTADIRHSKIRDLTQTRKLSKLRHLTVDQDMSSLEGMPLSVTDLRFAR
jgi:hypothetical protein